MSGIDPSGPARLWILCAVTAAVVLVGAAVAFSVLPRGSAAHLEHADGVTLLIDARSETLGRQGDSGDMVGGGGQLGLVARTCVGFLDDDTVLAWPPGTELVSRGDSFEVRVNGMTFRPGDRLDGGVGRPHGTDVRSLLPDACRDHEVVAFAVGG
ncbi:hypothetical protein [Intrasporangium flavum]|uniref:hypothetical protein n=1 Tax=Intrasporangium flavum TaxID=1428657 RepID=UPI00096F1A81|nr:hypothetical protein [Intrasporangium flavum]